MPFPNGSPTRAELEAEALKSIAAAEMLLDEGDIDVAQLHIGLAQARATLALGQRLEAISEGLPNAGGGG